MYTNCREDEVKLIKSLIGYQMVTCPVCKEGALEPFHKKARKSNTDYICKACGERYQVIKMMNELDQ